MRFLNDRLFAVVVFALAATALAAAMLFAPVALSMDGPSHMYTAGVMRHLLAGDALYREHFEFNSLLIPNWLASILTAVVAVAWNSRAGILMMNAFVILLTLGSLVFLIRQAGGPFQSTDGLYYTLAILLPLAANTFVTAGFWGFLISLDLCIVAVGLLQSHKSFGPRLAASILVLLAFWAHPVPVMVTALFPVITYASGMFARRGSQPPGRKQLTADFAIEILPWAVAGVLIIGFALHLATRQTGAPPDRLDVMNRLLGLAQAEGLSSFAPTATAGGVFLVYVTLLAVGVFSGVQHAATKFLRPQLIVFLSLLLILYLVVPHHFGNGTNIPERVLWIVIVTAGAIALSGPLAANDAYMRACACCAAIITIMFAGEYLVVSRRMRPAMDELRTAVATVPMRSKTLVLSYQTTPHCGRWPILDQSLPERHWALMETQSRELLVLNDYEPGTGHFPVAYRSDRFAPIINEFDFTPAIETAWVQALDRAEPGTFVLSWGVPGGLKAGCAAWADAPLVEALQRNYELRYQNANTSRVQVWERLAK